MICVSYFISVDVVCKCVMVLSMIDLISFLYDGRLLRMFVIWFDVSILVLVLLLIRLVLSSIGVFVVISICD